jgi:hypothetical protein
MTPKDSTANEKAIDALIAASLRWSEKQTDLTEEDIRRFLEQQVTLSSEDEAALEKSKSALLRAIRDILQGSEQEGDCCHCSSESENKEHSQLSTHQKASAEFVEAVVIAQLTRAIATPNFPLGWFRYNKLAYFSRRKADEDVSEHFLKKAAGPYSPWARYQGPERIAVKNGYVKRAKAGVYAGLLAGDQIDKIDQYLSRYSVCAAVDWAVSQFRYRKNDDLELLATVDFAALDLKQQGIEVTSENVKQVIAANKEWAPKLKREIFSDENIARALDELHELLPGTYQ